MLGSRRALNSHPGSTTRGPHVHFVFLEIFLSVPVPKMLMFGSSDLLQCTRIFWSLQKHIRKPLQPPYTTSGAEKASKAAEKATILEVQGRPEALSSLNRLKPENPCGLLPIDVRYWTFLLQRFRLQEHIDMSHFSTRTFHLLDVVPIVLLTRDHVCRPPAQQGLRQQRGQITRALTT